MTRQQDSLTLDMPIPEEIMELETQIQSRLSSRICDFRLTVRDDGLVLEGHTHSYYAKQLAQHAVLEASDLPIVANEIKVIERDEKRPTGQDQVPCLIQGGAS